MEEYQKLKSLQIGGGYNNSNLDKKTDFNRNGLAVLNESLVCKIVEK